MSSFYTFFFLSIKKKNPFKIFDFFFLSPAIYKHDRKLIPLPLFYIFTLIATQFLDSLPLEKMSQKMRDDSDDSIKSRDIS